MEKRLTYVLGFPLNRIPAPKDFARFNRRYRLKEGIRRVFSYKGSLTSKDFTALRDLLTSKEYLDIGERPTQGQIDRLLTIVRAATLGPSKLILPYDTQPLPSLSETSEAFFPAVEEILGLPEKPGHLHALNYLLEQAKEDGKYIKISSVYRYENTCGLSSGRTLVFIDDELGGEVTLKKTREFQDQWAGHTEEGLLTIKIGEQSATAKWNSWGHGVLVWTVDPLIREKLLKEKKEGIVFIDHGGRTDDLSVVDVDKNVDADTDCDARRDEPQGKYDQHWMVKWLTFNDWCRHAIAGFKRAWKTANPTSKKTDPNEHGK